MTYHGVASDTALSAEKARAAGRSADFSAPQTAVLFVVFALVAAIPIITHPLPPLEDYVNHLARMHVIASINKDADLARFYSIDWQIVPNLTMDLIVPWLVRVMSVYQAGQVFIIALFVLVMSGTLMLNRALFGHLSALPLLAFPLLYNHVFLIGTMNYLFGVGVALWALACWVALRERSAALRLALSTVFVLALFFCHLFAVGVYGVGLLAVELQRLWERRERPITARLLAFCATGLPFLPVVPLLLASPTWSLAGENYWDEQGKIDGLIFVIQTYSDIVAFALAAIVAAAAVWATRRGLLRFHPLGGVILLVGGIIYLALPRVAFATYLADQRLPIALAFMLVACAHLQLRHRLVRRGFLAIALVMLVVRVIEVDVNWTELSQVTAEFRDSVKRIKRGSAVLVAYANRGEGDNVRDLELVHAACIAMIERSALVTTAFTVSGKQIMHVRPAYAGRVDVEDGTPPGIDQLVLAAQRPDQEPSSYWRRWPLQYDYVYVLFTDDDAINPAPELLTLVHDGDRFQLYKVRKPESAAQNTSPPLK
jgi:hypothetical protein